MYDFSTNMCEKRSETGPKAKKNYETKTQASINQLIDVK